MHAISSYRGNRPTNKHTHTHPQTGLITIHCAAASVQCNYNTKGLWSQTLWQQWSLTDKLSANCAALCSKCFLSAVNPSFCFFIFNFSSSRAGEISHNHSHIIIQFTLCTWMWCFYIFLFTCVTCVRIKWWWWWWWYIYHVHKQVTVWSCQYYI